MPHPIARHLYAIAASTGNSFFRLYDDWLAVATAAFCRDGPAYLKILAHYGPRIPGKDHPADHFAKALGEFLATCQRESALGTPFPDTLGAIYEREAATNAYAGQFFTPEHLCRMMAQMIATPDQPETSDTPSAGPKSLNVYDPACGSGRFLIHLQPLVHAESHFTGIDRDLTCVHMTTLNMLARNANAVLIHGNTLSLECWGGYQIRRTPLGGEIRTLTAAEASTFLTAAAKTQAEQQSAPTVAPAAPRPDAASPETTAKPFMVDGKGQFGFDF